MSKELYKKKFDKCPNCGSEERFMEKLTIDLKAMGLIKKEASGYYDSREGTLLTPDRFLTIPIGFPIPGFKLDLDICSDCGTVYVVNLERTERRFDGISKVRKGIN